MDVSDHFDYMLIVESLSRNQVQKLKPSRIKVRLNRTGSITMSGIVEASLVLGLISSTIAVFEAPQEIYEATNDASGLPKKFQVAAE